MRKNNTASIKPKRKLLSIRWKMLVIILAFIILFSAAIWIFQIQMLNYFYQAVKYKELNVTVEMLDEVKNKNNDEIVATVSERAQYTYDDIWVYRIENGYIVEDEYIVFSEGVNAIHAHFLQSNFDRLYEEAKSNNNRYIGVFSANDGFYDLNIIDDNKEGGDDLPYIKNNVDGINSIQVDVLPLEDGRELVIIQRANLEPVAALKNTIKTQVFFISAVLIVFAVILVMLISRAITKPIIKINESAKNLGKGNYDIKFEGDNYREVSELSDTLNYAAAELSKNDKLQKELISNVSHDLRTPLTMIRGYSEIMQDIPGEVTPENLQIIIDETTRLTELVNGMLDLSKIQSGVRVPEKQLFCLTEIIKSTLVRYEKLVTQDGYKIEFFFDDEVFVCADRNMILQVIYNFINNAVNYTGDDKYIRVEQKVIGNDIRISITDTGEGISDEQLPYIWDRYYKVDKVHRRATVGTGLGLSIVKGILEAHEANYGVESEVGKGSTFYFELEKVDPKEYGA